MIEVIAWDYDGVFTRNLVDGDYCGKNALSGYIFDHKRFRDWQAVQYESDDQSSLEKVILPIIRESGRKL